MSKAADDAAALVLFFEYDQLTEHIVQRDDHESQTDLDHGDPVEGRAADGNGDDTAQPEDLLGQEQARLLNAEGADPGPQEGWDLPFQGSAIPAPALEHEALIDHEGENDRRCESCCVGRQAVSLVPEHII